MNVQLPSSLGEHFQRVVLDDVAPKRDESRSNVIYDEDAIFVDEAVQQNVEARRINSPVTHERQVFGPQLGILRKSFIYRVTVDAMDLSAVMAEVLGENAGDQALPPPPLPCNVMWIVGCGASGLTAPALC